MAEPERQAETNRQRQAEQGPAHPAHAVLQMRRPCQAKPHHRQEPAEAESKQHHRHTETILTGAQEAGCQTQRTQHQQAMAQPANQPRPRHPHPGQHR